MPNQDYTALVLIIDSSGSMARISASTEEALRELLQSQAEEPGKLTVDTVFFNTTVEERGSFLSPEEALDGLSLRPSGSTALYDAVGTKITSFGSRLAELPEEERPGRVIVVVATDGLENASNRYTRGVVADLIKQQQDTYSWVFTFIGANQDAVLAAGDLGIGTDHAITFAATEEGTSNVLRSVSTYLSAARSGSSASYTAADRVSAVAGAAPDSPVREARTSSSQQPEVKSRSTRRKADPKA